METINQLFDRLDCWRHLPNYQLERRADLFFSLYLPEALEAKLGFPIPPELIPEFPVRVGTIYPKIPINKSFKIDYLALSRSGDEAIFVELKTEGLSRRPKQDAYLTAACRAGMSNLLEGLLLICKATSSKGTYRCLLNSLSLAGLLRVPPDTADILRRETLQGIGHAFEGVQIISQVKRCHIMYVQPKGEGPDIISFQDFQATVGKHDDPVSSRFRQSLAEWSRIPAGGL